MFKAIYFRNLSIEEVERLQEGFDAVLAVLERYNPNNPKHKESREKLLINAKTIYDGREMIINAFKNIIFRMNPDEDDSDRDYISKRDRSPDKGYYFDTAVEL